ncbi:MAG TPA: Pr6Pr family membrane protein [Hanamia sp.]
MQQIKNFKSLAIAIMILGWIAVIGQFYLIIMNRTASVGETIIRFFSYFTILTNLLVALCFTFLLTKSSSALRSFFFRKSTLTAMTVYILIVGLVYNLILRFLWQPQGLQFVVDELLHTIIPILCLIFWWQNERTKNLEWRNIFPFLIYPLLYILIILVRGSFSGFYPYPFIDVKLLGMSKVIINSGLLAICFAVISAIFIGITRYKQSKRINNPDFQSKIGSL